MFTHVTTVRKTLRTWGLRLHTQHGGMCFSLVLKMQLRIFAQNCTISQSGSHIYSITYKHLYLWSAVTEAVSTLRYV